MSTREEEELRQGAIIRFLSGARPLAIYRDLGRSKRWFFKWLGRYKSGSPDWYVSQYRTPHRLSKRLSPALESKVVEIRSRLLSTKYSQIGANAINWELRKTGLGPLPISTINRVIKRSGLTRKREKRASRHISYIDWLLEPCPWANHIHQADLVGPRFLKNDGRFYSLNVMDVGTHRVKVNPLRGKGDEGLAQALVASWQRLGLPDYLQMDNELSFHGSNKYPHSFGIVIRLCLKLGVQPLFIPIGEPWRNGEIERFQDVFDKSFFRSQFFPGFLDLCAEAKNFEQFHDQNHVYSCLGGKSPNASLTGQKIQLLPQDFKIPEKLPIEDGFIHVVRLIRSDRALDVFGEKFLVPAQLIYEYVVATICTEIHQLQVRHDNRLVQFFSYPIPFETGLPML